MLYSQPNGDLNESDKLDIMLPEKEGFDVCREVHSFYRNPILMLTACTEETDKILGLELGALVFSAASRRGGIS